jgi:hypothetical protein
MRALKSLLLGIFIFYAARLLAWVRRGSDGK